MQTRCRIVVGSIFGAVAIHVALVACGSADKTAAQGSDGGVLDAMRDVISDIVGNETHDAVAAVDAGTCGCTVSGPIQNTAASENPTQLRAGNLTGLGSAGSVVVQGPSS